MSEEVRVPSVEPRDGSLAAELRVQASERTRAVATLLLDAAFIAVCVLISYGLQHLVDLAELPADQQWEIDMLVWLSQVSTVGLAVVWLVRDFVIAVMRAISHGR